MKKRLLFIHLLASIVLIVLASYQQGILASAARPTTRGTSLLIESTPNPSEPNQAITISGRLVSGGQGLGYANVRIDSSVDGKEWKVAAWTKTRMDGRFALSWTPPQSTSLYIRSYYLGDKRYSSSSSNTILQQVIYPSELPRLYVDGGIIKSKFGQVHLFGCAYRGWTRYPYPDDNFWDFSDIHAKTIDEEYGFDAVILVTYWNYIELSPSPDQFVYDEEYIGKIIRAIEAFNTHGIYVILHVHSAPSERGTSNLRDFLPNAIDPVTYKYTNNFWTEKSSTSAREHLKNLWLKLSSVFKNDWGIAGYYLLAPTPPAVTLTDQEKQVLHDLWYDHLNYVTSALRENGDNHIIFASESPHASQMNYMKYLLNDKNTVYMAMFYQGTDEAPGGGNVINNNLKWMRTKFGGTDEAWGLAISNKMAEFPSVPFMISEYGYLFKNTIGDEKDIWIQNAHTIFRQTRLAGWFYWCFAAKADGVPWTTGTWIQRLKESVAHKPTIVHAFLSGLLSTYVAEPSTFPFMGFYSKRLLPYD